MGRTVALSLLLNAARLVAGAAVDTNSRNTLSLSAGGVSGSEQQQGSSNCVSISEAANDFWCATNCGKDGHCPPSICKCGVDLDTGNITAEQMDYLKSSSRNAEKYSKEVPCLTMEEVAKARRRFVHMDHRHRACTGRGQPLPLPNVMPCGKP